MFHKFSIKKRRYSVPFGKRIPSFLCYTKSISRILNQIYITIHDTLGYRENVTMFVRRIGLGILAEP